MSQAQQGAYPTYSVLITNPPNGGVASVNPLVANGTVSPSTDSVSGTAKDLATGMTYNAGPTGGGSPWTLNFGNLGNHRGHQFSLTAYSANASDTIQFTAQ